jgi:hypothetical protein
MTVLFPWVAPSVSELVVAWLLPIGAANSASVERPTGAILPFRMVNRVASRDDKVTDNSTVSVHTFALTMTEAESEAMLTHRRMLALGPPLAPQQMVTISTGVVYADCVESSQGPVWIDYEDNQIRRFVARYEIDLRFVAAP